MFRDFQNTFSFSLTLEEVAIRFVVALACGLIISVFYRWSYRGTSYSAAFVISLVALSMITASVIMVIGNNLARAFGLVGAMSIIRFRAAIKDTVDLMFIFFSLAMGLAAGVGLHVVAITGTIIIGLVVWLLTLFNFAAPVRKDYLLQFTYVPISDDTPSYARVLDRYCRKHKLINVKSVGETDELLEMSFYVRLKNPNDSGALIREMGRLRDVRYANLFFDEVQV